MKVGAPGWIKMDSVSGSKAIERNSVDKAVIGKDAEAPSLLGAYLKQVRKVPLLKAEEEVDLANRAAQGDEEARQRMIRANLRLVVKIAKAYVNRGVPFMDLIEEGNIGLIKGVERFKAEKGCRFSTYGSWWIRQGIERAVYKQSRTIRVPVHVCEDMAKLKRVERALEKESGREPTNEEAVERSGFTSDYIKRLKKAAQTTCSLETTLDDNGELSLGEAIADEDAVDVTESIWEGERNDLLNSAIDKLSERHRAVVRMRYGLESDEPMTLKQIGNELGVTRERARQIEIDAIARLRAVMSSTTSMSVQAA